MTINEILIWEATNVLLLIPVVMALVTLMRWVRGQPLFTERDWLFLFGQTRERVFSVRFWIRFTALWLMVVIIGFVERYVLFPLSFAAFVGFALLTASLVWRVAPKWLRC